MPEYKQVTTKDGKILHYKDGRLTSKADYEVNKQPTVKTVDEKLADAEKKMCIFCGKSATRTKWLNGEVIRLCNDDYLNHTSGEIAEQVRKTN